MCVIVASICQLMNVCFFFFFFKQKTAYEMRISDWSSDVCSSDLSVRQKIPWKTMMDPEKLAHWQAADDAFDQWLDLPDSEREAWLAAQPLPEQNGRASCRERVCQYV